RCRSASWGPVRDEVALAHHPHHDVLHGNVASRVERDSACDPSDGGDSASDIAQIRFNAGTRSAPGLNGTSNELNGIVRTRGTMVRPLARIRPSVRGGKRRIAVTGSIREIRRRDAHAFGERA